MASNSFYILVVLALVLSYVSATKGSGPKPRKKGRNAGLVSKTDIPTAEQILGKLLGLKTKTPEQQAAAALSASVAPQALSALYPSTSQARSPYKSLLGNLQLLQPQGATPQTEGAGGIPGLALPNPPPGYHYGKRRRKRPKDDEYEKDDGREDEEEEDDEEEDNPADGEYHDQRNSLGVGHGRGRNLENRRKCGQGCSCICWKGIKPHVEWVRVPVCYRPCGVCCPKHEEEGASAAVCHPCHCCHCCCCHHCPCHCCHCCHCCGRRSSITIRPPMAPLKIKKCKCKMSELKSKKQTKKNKIKAKKSTSPSKKSFKNTKKTKKRKS